MLHRRAARYMVVLTWQTPPPRPGTTFPLEMTPAVNSSDGTTFFTPDSSHISETYCFTKAGNLVNQPVYILHPAHIIIR